MIPLARTHPVQLVIGSVLIADEMARRGGQLTLAVWCEKASEWACDCRDVLTGLAEDSELGRMMVREFARDRVFAPAEERQLDRHLERMGREAREGRVLG